MSIDIRKLLDAFYKEKKINVAISGIFCGRSAKNDEPVILVELLGDDIRVTGPSYSFNKNIEISEDCSPKDLCLQIETLYLEHIKKCFLI